MILAAFTALKMQSISKAWEFIFSMGAGIGLVLILRWFWWRINAWSEITALATSIIITITLELIAWNQTISAGETYSLFGTAPVLFGVQPPQPARLFSLHPLTYLIFTHLLPLMLSVPNCSLLLCLHPSTAAYSIFPHPALLI